MIPTTYGIFGVAAPLTYTLDLGDGNPTGTCAMLGSTMFGGMSPTTLPGLSVQYSTLGAKMAVLKVFRAAECPVGTMPTNYTAPAVVGSATIQVWPHLNGYCQH